MTPHLHLGQDHYPATDPSKIAGSGFSRQPWLFDHIYANNSDIDVRDLHNRTIRELRSTGTVLSNRVNGVLPLRKFKNIGVLVNDAGTVVDGLYFACAPISQIHDYGKSHQLHWPC